jgi:hypothetical protein
MLIKLANTLAALRSQADAVLRQIPEGMLYAIILAAFVGFLAAMMTWASRMAVRKNRSRLWVFWVFLCTPFVLLLWCLPPRRRAPSRAARRGARGLVR